MICVAPPKLIYMWLKHEHETGVSVSQLTEHKITCAKWSCLYRFYVHPMSTMSRPLKNNPLGKAQANNSLSSLYDIMLDAAMLVIATAVKEAQMIAENPVNKIRILYKACNTSSIVYPSASIGQYETTS